MKEATQTTANRALNEKKYYLVSPKENLAIARVFSFVLALIFSVIILFNPHFVASTSETIQHGLLSIQMLAISCGYIHGIGFSARKIYFQFLLSPLFHWPVILSLLI